MRISSRTDKERGATMVEFVITSMLLVLMTSLVIDIGLALQDYGSVSSKIMRLVRHGATVSCPLLASSPDPDKFSRREFHTKDLIDAMIANELGTSALIGEVTVRDGEAFDELPVLEAKAEVKFSCIFCMMVPGGFDAIIGSRAIIQDLNADCF